MTALFNTNLEILCQEKKWIFFQNSSNDLSTKAGDRTFGRNQKGFFGVLIDGCLIVILF